jgi:DNA-binding transcriptional LysR family regulator
VFSPILMPRATIQPATHADYLAARHITVVYTDNERLDFDRRLEASGLHRDIAISVPSFSGVPAFLRGSDMLASMPSLLADDVVRGFASARVPLPSRAGGLAKLPMLMVWHQRYHKDPASGCANSSNRPAAWLQPRRRSRFESCKRRAGLSIPGGPGGPLLRQ